jgi:RNA recognition motif-containing protein
VGNINNKTTKEDLKDLFSKYGAVDKSFIIYHHKTKQSRGFGFVEFLEKVSVEKVIADKANIFLHGNQLACKKVELKKEVI